MKYLLVSLWLFGLSLLQGCGGEIVSSTTATPPSPPASLAITSSTPPSGTAGAAYAGSGFLLTASGGAAPYQWKWVPALGSSLPEPDLHLSPSGLISGMPQVGGTYDVIVTVTDASSPAAQVSTNYSIAIAGPPTFAITSGTPPNGTVGVDYGPMTTEYLSCVWSPVLGWHLVCTQCPSYASCASLPPCRGISPTPCLLTKQIFLGFTFTAVGGVPPYTWSGSGLPAGLDVDPSSGQITGTPTTAGSYSFTITVSDAASPPAQLSATYIIDIATSSTEASLRKSQ